MCEANALPLTPQQTGIIIDSKRYNGDEVADMLHDNDDDEVVGIPNNGDQSDDEKEWADEEPDELIDETQLLHRVRNRAERAYPILDEGEISDEFQRGRAGHINTGSFRNCCS